MPPYEAFGVDWPLTLPAVDVSEYVPVYIDMARGEKSGTGPGGS